MALGIFDPIFKMRLSRLFIVVLLLLVSVPLVTHYFLLKVDRNLSKNLNLDKMDPEAARNKLKLLDLDGLSGDELKERIDDLLRIKHSVLTELRYIEQDRAEKLKQKSEMDRLINKLKGQATREQSELEKLRVSISQAHMLQKELAERNNPEVLPPLRILSALSNNYIASDHGTLEKCSMGKCFDLARCPLSSGFPVYFYQNSELTWMNDGDGFGYKSEDPRTACLFVSVVDFNLENDFSKDLKYWKGDGRNHLLVDISSSSEITANKRPSLKLNPGKALIASFSLFNQSSGVNFRPKFDLALPLFSSRVPSPELWSDLAPMMPVRRKHLLSFEGRIQYSDAGLVKDIMLELGKINQDQTDDQVSSTNVLMTSPKFINDLKFLLLYRSLENFKILSNP